MKRIILLCLVIGEAAGVYAELLKDSKAELYLRNMYVNRDYRNRHISTESEWGQSFTLRFKSGYTEGPIGFGIDLTSTSVLRLDDGGSNDGRLAAMFPSKHNGKAERTYSVLDPTFKMKYSKTKLEVGSFYPNNPILRYNDGRLVPQAFFGQQITSNEFDNATIILGKMERARGRASTNKQGLATTGARAGVATNKFYFGGIEYKLTKTAMVRYYYGNLKDFYRQHFLGANDSYQLGAGKLNVDLYYWHSGSDGKNGTQRGRDKGYVAAGYYGNGRTRGKVNNNTYQTYINYQIKNHDIGVGYLAISGKSNMSFVDQNAAYPESGTTSAPLLTQRGLASFSRAGERAWFTNYTYNFKDWGLEGLKAQYNYTQGHDIKTARGKLREWERDFAVSYTVQEGLLKDVVFEWRNAMLRSEVVGHRDENRLYVHYTLPLF